METIEISQAEMATRIARFSDQESQSAHYAEALGIPRAAYEIDPPPLNWSTVYFSERRIKDGNETTQTRRDSLQVTAG